MTNPGEMTREIDALEDIYSSADKVYAWAIREVIKEALAKIKGEL